MKEIALPPFVTIIPWQIEWNFVIMFSANQTILILCLLTSTFLFTPVSCFVLLMRHKVGVKLVKLGIVFRTTV